MEAGKTIIEVGLAARMKNPGFFVQKMYKNVHTRLEANKTEGFHKIKKIYGSVFSFSRIFLVKNFFGLKTTFEHFHAFSLIFTFIHTILKNLFRKVHKKVHTCYTAINLLSKYSRFNIDKRESGTPRMQDAAIFPILDRCRSLDLRKRGGIFCSHAFGGSFAEHFVQTADRFSGTSLLCNSGSSRLNFGLIEFSTVYRPQGMSFFRFSKV